VLRGTGIGWERIPALWPQESTPAAPSTLALARLFGLQSSLAPPLGDNLTPCPSGVASLHSERVFYHKS
jgi:hypothetical protein